MPAPAPLFQNAAISIFADPDGFQRFVWSGQPHTLADIRAAFEQSLTQLRQRGWSRVLIDQTAMRPYSGEEQTWIATDWLPRAVREGGYRHAAIVVSADVLSRLATAYISTTPQHYPTYRSFDTEAEARAWLLRQPARPGPLPARLA